MKLCTSYEEANKTEFKLLCLPLSCPFCADNFCANWCPHFHVIYGPNRVPNAVKLTCGCQECIVRLEK